MEKKRDRKENVREKKRQLGIQRDRELETQRETIAERQRNT